jgi:hypothetical protein
MRSYPSLGALVLLGACGGGPGSLPIALTASPTSSPPDAMACARAKLDTLGYAPTSFDQTDLWLTVHKVDNSVHRGNPKYRHNIDRLEVESTPGADGKTRLNVIGRTYADYSTERGPTEVEETASAGVRQSAQAVVAACGH